MYLRQRFVGGGRVDVKSLSNKNLCGVLDKYEKIFILFLAYYEATTVPEYIQALESD